MQLDVVVEEVRLIDQSLLAAVAANGHLYVLDREDGRMSILIRAWKRSMPWPFIPSIARCYWLVVPRG